MISSSVAPSAVLCRQSLSTLRKPLGARYVYDACSAPILLIAGNSSARLPLQPRRRVSLIHRNVFTRNISASCLAHRSARLRCRQYSSAARCPFDILGVGKDANDDEVKRAYFELAKQHHPDLNDDEDAHMRFQEISDAYTLLIDKDERSAYESGQRGRATSSRHTGASAKEEFRSVFEDLRFRKSGKVSEIMEERALHAVLELKRGNQIPARDFVVQYKLPPQHCLPSRLKLTMSATGEAHSSECSAEEAHDERFLAAYRDNVEMVDSKGRTGLVRAAAQGRAVALRTLIDWGANVDSADVKGRTGLMYASAEGKLEVVKVLLQSRASLDKIDVQGRTALLYALTKRRWDVARALMSCGATLRAGESKGAELALHAAVSGQWDIVRLLAEHGVNIEASDSKGRTVLLCASSAGQWDTVRFLVERGASIDVGGLAGITPIGHAAAARRWDMVRFLAQRGANLEKVDAKGTSLLLRAAVEGNWDMVRFLAEHGAHLDARDAAGRTALMHAAAVKRLDVVRWLLERGVDANASDSQGRNALAYATAAQCMDIAQIFNEFRTPVFNA